MLIDTPSGTDRAAIATRREALRTAHAVIVVYDLSAGDPTERRSLSTPGGDHGADAEEEEEEGKDAEEKAAPPQHGSLGRVRSAWLPVVRATARRGTPVVLAGTKLDLVPPASPVASYTAVSPPTDTPQASADAEVGGEAELPVGAEAGASVSAVAKPQPPAPAVAAVAAVPSDDAVAALQAAQAAVMAKDGGIEVIVICSPMSGCYNVAAVFHYATASVIYPSGPLYHDSSPVLRPRAAAALHAIFHACDVDRDGLLCDSEMAAFQTSCLHEPLTDDGVSTVKQTLAEACPTGLRALPTGTGGGGSSVTGITPGGFVSLHTIIARNGRLDTLWRVVRSHGYDNSLWRVGDWDPARGLPPPLVPPPGGRGGGVARVLSPEAEAFLRRFHAGIVDAATAAAVAAGSATLADRLGTSGASMGTIDAAFAGSPVHPFRRSLVGGDLDAAVAGEDMSPRAGGVCADVEPRWEDGAPLDTRGWVGSPLETLLPGPVNASSRMTEDAWVAAWGVAVATEPDAALTALAHIGYCSVLRPCAAPAPAASASTAVTFAGGRHSHKSKEHHHKNHHHHGGGTSGATTGRASVSAASAAVDARRPPPPVLLTAPRRREVEADNVSRPLLVAYLFGGPGAGKTQVARALVGAPFAAAASPTPAGVPPPPRGEHPTVVGGVWVDVHPDWGGGRRLLLVREVAAGLEGPTLASPALEAADVAVLVFDSTDADSLDAATSLHRRVVAAAPRLPTVFVAAKADLLDSSDSSLDDSSESAEDSDDDDDADAEGQADPDDDSSAARRRAHRVRRRARHAVVADADAYCKAEDLSTAVRVAAATGDPEDGAEVAGMLVGVATHPRLACPRLEPPAAADAAVGEDKPRSRRPPASSTRAVAVKAVVAAAAVAVTVVVAKRLYAWYVSRPPSAVAA